MRIVEIAGRLSGMLFVLGSIFPGASVAGQQAQTNNLPLAGRGAPLYDLVEPGTAATRSGHRGATAAATGQDVFSFTRQFGSNPSAPGALNIPEGIALDPMTGDVYVADSANNRVQKFDSTGNFIKQFGTAGGGAGQFLLPQAVAVDGSGNVYIADTLNSRIEKFDSGGNFVLQFGEVGQGNGQFALVGGIAIGINGNLYILDVETSRVQEFDTSGNFLATIASGCQGTPCDAGLNWPEAIAAGAGGDLYVADTQNKRIVKYGPNGNYLQQFDISGAGIIGFPERIATDTEGNLYVTSTVTNVYPFTNGDVELIKLDQNGNFLANLGRFGPGIGGALGSSYAYQLGLPVSAAVDSQGDIYLAQSGNSQVQKLSPTGSVELTWGGSLHGPGEFNFPQGVAVDGSGNLYVVDSVNARVEKFNARGRFLSQFNTGLVYPLSVAVDGQGNVYVADYGYIPPGVKFKPPKVEKFDSSGNFLFNLGSAGGWAVATDLSGNVYVVNDVVQEFDSTGNFIRQIGEPGPGTGQLSNPTGVAVDGVGNVFVAEGDGVFKFDKNGNFLLEFGGPLVQAIEGGFGGFGPGLLMSRVAVDSSGNVYLTSDDVSLAFSGDFALAPVRKFDNDGNFLGKLGSIGTGHGQFFFPTSIAVDNSGNVYVTDEGQRVQVFSQGTQRPSTPAPAVSSAKFSGKTLTIKGKAFGSGPMVLINGTDFSLAITSESATSIKVAGNAGALGLDAGTNSVQVVNSFNAVSNKITFSAQ
jgi:DNA-binding beta-propeller fold protein YncE